MKKITFILLLLLAIILEGNAQCINGNLYPPDTVISNNLGIVQVIANNNYTSEYAVVYDIIPGANYVFTCDWIDPNDQTNLESRYVTVTDLSNTVLAYGPSPLTVTAITAIKIKVHFSDDSSCASTLTNHRTTLRILLSCPTPLDPSVSAITPTSAHFTWTAGGSETAWQVLVLAADAPAPTSATTGTAVSSASYTSTALSPSSNYKFYVRSQCGTDSSPWNSVSFASGCNPIAAFNETFEGTTDAALPVCWSSILRGPTLSEYAYVQLTDEWSHSGSRSVQINNSGSDSSGDDDIILVSPNMSTLGSGTYRLKFYTKNEGVLQVGTLDNNSITANFNFIENIETTNAAMQHTVNFNTYTGSDTYIGIRMNVSDYSSIYLDDILWELIPNCPDVTDISIPSVTPDTATIEWIAGGVETSWDIAVGVDSVTDPNTLPFVTSTSNTKEISGLTDNTNYKAWVRSVCTGNDKGAWIGPIWFTSDCLPTVNFYEDFDDASTPALPSCWTKILRGENLSDYAYIATTESDHSHSSPNSVVMYRDESDTDGTDDIILVSPNLSSLATGSHRLKFYARGSEGKIQVGTLDNNTNIAAFTYLEQITLSGSMQQYAVDFTSYTGEDKYVGIRMNNNSDNGGYEVYLDDILWEVSPTCQDVTDVHVASVTPNSTTIEWIAGGPEASWDIAVGTTGVTDPSTLPFVSSTATSKEVTGLAEHTEYKAWVRAVCDGNDQGAWIGPVLLKTDCLAVSAFYEDFDAVNTPEIPSCWTTILRGSTISEYASIATDEYPAVHSDPNVIVLSNSDSNLSQGNDIILVSPNLSSLANGTHRLKFYARGQGGAIQVGTMNSNTASGTFNEIDSFATSANPVQYTIEFASYTGTDRYIGIRMNSQSTYSSIAIDDILWELSPSCADVTEVTVASVSPNGAIISWTGFGSEESWDIAVGAASATDPAALPFSNSTVPNKTIGGLEVASDYKVWVRSVCTGNDKGVWIGPVPFRTDCMPIATFNENFDDVNTPDIPACWTKIIRGAGISEYDAIESTYFESVHSDPQSVGLFTNESSPSTTDDIILVSPNLSTAGSGTHRLKFYAKGAGSIQVGTLDSNTGAATFNLIQEFETTNAVALYKANFTSYTGTDRYIGIRLNNEENYTAVYIDDAVWEVAPLCPDVTSVSVTSFTTTTANIDWTAGGTEGSWQIAYGGQDVTDPNTLTPGPSLTTTDSSISGLTAGTGYKVWVRSVCTGINGDWMGPLAFTTSCNPATIASTVTEGFEGTPNGELPVCWYEQLISGEGNWETKTPAFFEDISVTNSGTKIVYKSHFNSDAVLYSYPLDYTGVTTATRVNTYLHRQEFAAPTDKYTVYVNTVPSLDGAVQILEVHSLTTEQPEAPSTGFHNYLADIPSSFNGQPQVYLLIEGVTSEDWQSFGLGMDDFKVEFSDGLGIPGFEENDFSYYPNPVKDVLNLSYSQAISAVAVYNILGQKVAENSIHSNTVSVDMSGLPSGNYIVKVSTDNQVKTVKVIKQ